MQRESNTPADCQFVMQWTWVELAWMTSMVVLQFKQKIVKYFRKKPQETVKCFINGKTESLGTINNSAFPLWYVACQNSADCLRQVWIMGNLHNMIGNWLSLYWPLGRMDVLKVICLQTLQTMSSGWSHDWSRGISEALFFVSLLFGENFGLLR